MGFREVTLVFDYVENLSPAQKLLLVALADRANESGQCWPSLTELAVRSCQSRSSVKRHVRVLEELGILRVSVRRQVDSMGRSRQATNVYTLDLAGMNEGRYSAKSSGVQVEPLKEKRRSVSGVQVEPLTVSGVQKEHSQGFTCEPPMKDQYNPPVPPSIPPNHQMKGSSDEFLGEGAAEPPGAPPVGGAGDWEVSSLGFSPSAAKNSSASHALSSGCSVDVITPPEATPVAGGEVRSAPSLSPADIDLVREVLPEAMQAIPLRDYPKIAAAIRQRLDAGWSRKHITATLAARCLPDRVRHLTALVMGRFRDDLPVDVPPPVSGAGGVAEWSHTLPDGRVITRRNIDFGLLAVDFRAAQRSGDPRATRGDRLRFAVEQGIEKYII